MRSLLLLTALCISLSPLGTNSNPAWPPTLPYGVIKGVVRDVDDGQGLTYATIALVEQRLAGMSNYDAVFSILFVPPGTYTLKTYMMGYKMQLSDSVTVQMGRTTEIIIKMKREVTPVIWEP